MSEKKKFTPEQGPDAEVRAAINTAILKAREWYSAAFELGQYKNDLSNQAKESPAWKEYEQKDIEVNNLKSDAIRALNVAIQETKDFENKGKSDTPSRMTNFFNVISDWLSPNGLRRIPDSSGWEDVASDVARNMLNEILIIINEATNNTFSIEQAKRLKKLLDLNH